MAVETGTELVKVVVLLAAGVVAVPLFRRLGLGSVLGYLAAGVAIGPFGMGFFSEAQTILHLAELGVVMFLFVIGLEMQPSRLWGLRRQIFGLGLAQVLVCTALLTAAGAWLGFSPVIALVAAAGFVLSSTAIVMQLLDESGDSSTPRGQRIVSILLLEDLAIVPLLAMVAFLAPHSEGATVSRWVTVGAALAAVIGLVAVSRWLLNPLFRVLARSGAREVMTAAALLVVLGAALTMQWGGLSMALGAFAAGVMLSESTFRHQLEADIEPFRGILLGLFFMGVGMALDLRLVWADWPVLLGGVAACMALKGLGVYSVARIARSSHAEALQRTMMMAQGGEFAFVLYSAAAAAGAIEARVNAVLTAAVILSMALTPLAVMSLRWLLPAEVPPEQDMEGVEAAEGLSGSVLIIGFGRFGQIASQLLLARGIDIATIEKDTDMIRAAARFGFKVYYGDGTRRDVLHASGAHHAKAILVCVDDPKVTTQIVQLLQHECPHTPILARAFDRQHATELLRMGVDFQMRETFESALGFGMQALRTLGEDDAAIALVAEDIRRRDTQRLQLQVLGEIDKIHNVVRDNKWVPSPFVEPQREGRALNEEAADAIEQHEPPTEPPAPSTHRTRATEEIEPAGDPAPGGRT